MITFTTGDLFESGCDALVNPVNCEGISGKRLALEFKKRYPIAQGNYERICKSRRLYPGIVKGMWSNSYGDDSGPYIIYFPTKDKWKNPSKLEYIHDGLIALRQKVDGYWADRIVDSVAIPALGSGLGGLDWNDVKEAINYYLAPVKDVNFYVYEPQ